MLLISCMAFLLNKKNRQATYNTCRLSQLDYRLANIMQDQSDQRSSL